jgi:hypothetical protein
VGAASLADSYVNEANPGTNDAAPGVAPTWAYGTGWTFDGATQYLTTGITPLDAYSFMIRFSNRTGTGAHCLMGVDVAGNNFDFFPYSGGSSYWQRNGGFVSDTAKTAGVSGLAGHSAYFNGAVVSVPFGPPADAQGALFIGCRNDGSPIYYTPADVQAAAIWSGTLDATDVTTITAAMNALPVASGVVWPGIGNGAIGGRLGRVAV